MQPQYSAEIGAPPPPPGNPIKARRQLWLALTIILVAVLLGGGWDQVWHLTHPFDGFFSPPHVFVYGCCTIAAAVILGMVLTPSIRLALGPSFRLPIFPFPMPGSLVIFGSGIVLAGLGGLVFDNIWHTTFGLDETFWSFPHALIGWAELIITLGAISCHLVLRRAESLRWYTALFLGLLLMLASAVPFMGPLVSNRSIAIVQAQTATSILASQPPALHALRIYMMWNLSRANPLLVVFAPLWVGAILAFFRRLDRRSWLLVVLVALWTLLDTTRSQAMVLATAAHQPSLVEHAANWSPLPLLLPTLLLLLLSVPRFRIPTLRAWGVAGFVLGLQLYQTFVLTTPGLLLCLVAIPSMLLGKRIGERTYDIIARPSSLPAVMTVIFLGIAVPLVTGMVDLTLRMNTP